MEQWSENNRQDGRFPGEVVEVYRQPDYREVVEVYSASLPRVMRPEAAQTAVTPEKRRRKKKGLYIFLGCLLAVVVLAVLSMLIGGGEKGENPRENGGFEWYYEEFRGGTGSGEITLPTWPVGQGAELELVRDHSDTLTIQEIYQTVNPAVVTVMVQLEDAISVGTGVIFRSDGYILTNHHVVSGGNECLVLLNDGYSYEAMYVAGDADNDLAILKVDANGLPAAEFGDSEDLVVGDPAYAIGNPLGMELRGTLTDGIISAINRDVEVNGRTMTLIQTNAALNEGNSGGPLINQYGQVVGINVIKMSSAYASVEGLGFAIPSAFIERMVNDLLTYGELKPEPKLGLYVMNMGTQLTDTLWGAEVDSVEAGGVADLAGIQKGDFIIEAGGLEVIDSGDVLRARRQYYVGEEMPMTIWRDGEIIEVVLQLTDAVE